jgi:hypothetical protein
MSILPWSLCLEKHEKIQKEEAIYLRSRRCLTVQRYHVSLCWIRFRTGQVLLMLSCTNPVHRNVTSVIVIFFDSHEFFADVS